VLTVVQDEETEALTAITQLLHRAEWRDSTHAPALQAQLASRLNAPQPHLRHLAITALPVTHPDPADRAATLATHLDTEDNIDVLTTALHALNETLPAHQADPILAAGATARTAGPTLTELVTSSEDSELSDLRGTWVIAHLHGALRAKTPHATTTVDAWFTDPANAEPLFDTAVAALRPAFSFDANGPNRTSAFRLIRTAAAALKTRLLSMPSDAQAMLAADTLIEQLLFACGKSDTTTTAPHPTADQKTRWFHDAMPALEDLAVVSHARSCYHLLETLEFLINEDPLRVFYTIAAAIKDDSYLRYEQLGAHIAVRIIDQYLSEHRHLFITQPQALTKLRRILEIFTTVGWPLALHRSYALGEIFR